MKKIIKRAYKFRCYPQNDLVILLAKTFGCSRFVNNHILDYSIKHYASRHKEVTDDFGNIVFIPNVDYKLFNANDRIKYITKLKEIPEYSFLKEVSSIALQQSVMHLNNAYNRFFKKESGYPQFKKKFNRNSFTITGKNSISFDKDFLKNKQFYLPKYSKPLKIKFSRNFNHLAVSSYTVSKEPSGKYYISFLVEEELTVKPVKNKAKNKLQKTSIDLGIKTTAKLYNGKEFKDCNLPDLVKNIDKKTVKAQKLLSRKKKGSKNRNKQRIKLARLHETRSNIITNYYQKLSTQIINENQVIIREDLNIKGMVKNKKLSKAISSVAWGKLLGMIDYKADWHNRSIIKANRYYASSKDCNKCGHKNHELKLSERQWVCKNPLCKVSHDRDENACINLHNYNEQRYLNSKVGIKNKKKVKVFTAVGTTVAACGGNVRPEVSKMIKSKKTKAVSVEARIPLL